jgi:quinol monooxygenase YgiN
MSLLAIAEVFVVPEKSEAFFDLLKEALLDTRSFNGCESLETYVNQDDPGLSTPRSSS